MRTRLAIAMALLLPGATLAEAEGPPPNVIVDMAQHYVLENFPRPPDRHFDLAFDLAQIHPQPDTNYWAVVGGLMADAGGNRYLPHVYVVALRLICPAYKTFACWRLEKLAIDETIVIDIGDPS